MYMMHSDDDLHAAYLLMVWVFLTLKIYNAIMQTSTEHMAKIYLSTPDLDSDTIDKEFDKLYEADEGTYYLWSIH